VVLAFGLQCVSFIAITISSSHIQRTYTQTGSIEEMDLLFELNAPVSEFGKITRGETSLFKGYQIRKLLKLLREGDCRDYHGEEDGTWKGIDMGDFMLSIIRSNLRYCNIPNSNLQYHLVEI
jgi:hypothetical protein